MNVTKHLYETVFVLNPELTEEDVEANVQSTVQLLENKGAEIIRIDRGGKRRLAYVMRKQRYGYYTLIHFRATPDPSRNWSGCIASVSVCCAISPCVLRKRNI